MPFGVVRPIVTEDGAPQTARADTVLKTLGYSRRQGRSGSSMKTLLLYGAGAVLVGFVGLALVIKVLAPSQPTVATQRSAAAGCHSNARTGGSPARTGGSAGAIELPTLPPSAPACTS